MRREKTGTKRQTPVFERELEGPRKQSLDFNTAARARRLKRVFGIEIEQCARCGGRLKVIASIEEPELIVSILRARESSWPAAEPHGTARYPGGWASNAQCSTSSKPC